MKGLVYQEDIEEYLNHVDEPKDKEDVDELDEPKDNK